MSAIRSLLFSPPATQIGIPRAKKLGTWQSIRPPHSPAALPQPLQDFWQGSKQQIDFAVCIVQIETGPQAVG